MKVNRVRAVRKVNRVNRIIKVKKLGNTFENLVDNKNKVLSNNNHSKNTTYSVNQLQNSYKKIEDNSDDKVKSLEGQLRILNSKYEAIAGNNKGNFYYWYVGKLHLRISAMKHKLEQIKKEHCDD